MSVKKEPPGRRSVQTEIAVQGTPEEVWQAIATGPGMSSWFVPTQFEERDGKPVSVKLSFGAGMEISSDALLRIDKPGPGVAALGTFSMGGPSIVAVNFYLYGNQASVTVARETPLWEAWFQERFPMPTESR